jgi:hypothetical protein
MLTTLLVEMKRAREFGFLEQEFEDAKKATLASAEQSAKTEGTWDMHAFLGRYNNSVAQKRKPMSEAQRLELLKGLLTGITLTEVSNAFKANFAPGQRLVLVTMPEKAGLKAPTEAEILAVANKAEAESVAKREAKERPKNLLETEPTPATVVSQEEDAETKILTATLSNGVKVRLRTMDFKKDEVYCSINIYGGKLNESAQTRGLGDAAGDGEAVVDDDPRDDDGEEHQCQRRIERRCVFGQRQRVAEGPGRRAAPDVPDGDAGQAGRVGAEELEGIDEAGHRGTEDERGIAAVHEGEAAFDRRRRAHGDADDGAGGPRDAGAGAGLVRIEAAERSD